MARSLACSMGALLLALGGTAVADPHVLVYGTPVGTSPPCKLVDFAGAALDPADLQNGNPNLVPMLPAALVPLGGSLPMNLCYLYWPPVDSDVAGGEVIGEDGSGTEVCAIQLEFTVNGGGITFSFTKDDPEPGLPDFRTRSDATRLGLAGGDPVDCQQGSESGGAFFGIRLGTLTLTGTGLNATFEAQKGSIANASLDRVAVKNQVIAQTMSTCGDGTLDPGEQCDDGNAVPGDGCFSDCRVESGFALSGHVGTGGGSLAWELEGVPLLVDLSTVPGAQADEVIEAVVTVVNESPTTTAQAIQADDPTQPGANDGRRVLFNRMLTDGPDITNGSGGTIATVPVPEPSELVMHLIGLGLLLGFGRRHPARGRTADRCPLGVRRGV